jgi:hypothetical protein
MQHIPIRVRLFGSAVTVCRYRYRYRYSLTFVCTRDILI